MSHKIPLFFLLLYPLVFAFGGDVGMSFYVWQRDRSPELEKALAAEPPDSNLFFAAGELEQTRAVQIPPTAVRREKSTAVIRIRVERMKDPANRLADAVLALYEPWREAGVRALQMDLDAPESKLARYADLLEELRKRHPDTELSATLLICHTAYPAELKKLAAVCDYLVLQVHGPDRSKQLLLDRAAAEQAIARMEALGIPFRVALPCYAVRDGDTVLAPELVDLAALSARTKRGRIPTIWFRLPVPGDDWCLDRATVGKINAGTVPETGLFPRWERQENGAFLLILENRGVFVQGEAVLTLIWPEGTAFDDFDTLHYFTRNAGLAPSGLTGRPPAPGTGRTILWARLKNTLTPPLPKVIYRWKKQ